MKQVLRVRKKQDVTLLVNTKKTKSPFLKELLIFTNLFLLEHSVQTPELWLRTEEEYRLCSALKRAVWGDTINEPDNGLAFEFRGFTVSFAEGKIFVSDEGRAFARYEISHFLQDPGAVVRGIRRECLQRDSMRELSKI